MRKIHMKEGYFGLKCGTYGVAVTTGWWKKVTCMRCLRYKPKPERRCSVCREPGHTKSSCEISHVRKTGKVFYVYINNHADCRDNDVKKVVANGSKKDVIHYFNSRSTKYTQSLAEVLTPTECRSKKDGWWSLLKDVEPKVLYV